MSLDLAAIQAAHVRIRPHIVRTPVLRSTELDEAAGGKLFFKCENLQVAGAFKSRGAVNAVFSLSDAEAAHGVATHSSGNHAAAVARAAQLRGIPAYIVMPITAPKAKIRNVGRYGGWIRFCESNLAAREEACARVVAETGAALIHPFDDYAVMAGQGTAVLELLEETPELDAVLCPVGGGGLLCGTAVAAKATRPGIEVFGVEPAQADDVAQSFRAGRRISIPSPATIADGLRTNCTGEKNLPIIRQYADGILTVSEDAIRTAMSRLTETLHVEIEPSAAVPYAAILEGKISVAGRRIGLILTGGN
ncbi:MAG: threonine/serine dehydratase, partial [Opitutales bacterium]